MKFIIIASSLALSNFAYQYFGDANWSVAVDRTWFQSGAVLTCWIISAITPSDQPTPNRTARD